jgi:PAS domain S-box-containing protein
MDQTPESAKALPEGLFQALLRQSVDAIVLLERDSRRFVEFSDSWCEMTGFTREELLGHTGAELGLTRAEEQAQVQRRVAAGRAGVFEIRMWRRDGEPRWLEYSSQQLGPNLDLTLVRDVTDRHSLQEIAERYQLLVESVKDYAIFLLDADGRVVSWNEGARRIKGYEAAEIVGRHFSVFYPPEDIESGKPAHALQTAVAEGRLEDEGWRLRKDGSRFWASVIIAPLRDPSGQLTGFAKVTRDVTEKLELRSQQAMRLESLGQLAGGVAHDFNNLLAVILNVTARLKAELEGTATQEITDLPDAARDLERIDKAANSASRLTRQLLAFARRQVVKPVVIDPNAEITGLLDLMRRTLGSHIKVGSDLSRDIWRAVMDPGLFEQVVVNLAVNARDAMSMGGVLSISTANVTIDEAFAKSRPGLETGRYVRIQVADTGTGMDKATLAHIFEPFFTTKPAGHGTGLGLATIYGIVKQAKGHVAIYSELGIGTTVTVFIPATDSALPVARATSAPAAEKRSGGTVLLVEDYQDLRELFVEILEGAGYRVLAAPDGAVALNVAREHAGEIDVLLSDIVMPNMLGTDLAEKLLAENPDLRVVFMSGYAQPILGNATAIPEDIPLLQKPLMQNDLLEKLEQVLSTPR